MSVRNILAIAAILVCALSIRAIPVASQGNFGVNDLSLPVANYTQSDGKTTASDRRLLVGAPHDAAPAPPAANGQDVQAPAAGGDSKTNANAANGNALPSQAANRNRTVEAPQSWLEYGLLALLLAMVLLLAANLLVGRMPPKPY
ncbi:MAG TPA: hypothetical protein VF952_02685 [Chloroflexia bacterium]